MDQGNRPRRRHEAGFKQRVLAECAQPGASVAAVALAHGVNANLVHKWRRQAAGRERVARRPNETFVAVPLAAAPVAGPAAAITIDVRRGATSARIQWPVAAAAECAAWLRGWLA